MISVPLLRVEHLDVSFMHGEQSQKIVKDVSFSINAGETFALVGESGSGKSVTAHSLLKLLPYAEHSSASRIYLHEQEGQKNWHDFPRANDGAQSFA
jgi:microcin C transport system ATP-binding protein